MLTGSELERRFDEEPVTTKKYMREKLLSQFGFQVKVLLDNLTFLFPQLSHLCLLPCTVTESPCQVFCGTISINCGGQFYSAGWHRLTLITTNCSASNAVWGPPA